MEVKELRKREKDWRCLHRKSRLSEKGFMIARGFNGRQTNRSFRLVLEVSGNGQREH